MTFSLPYLHLKLIKNMFARSSKSCCCCCCCCCCWPCGSSCFHSTTVLCTLFAQDLFLLLYRKQSLLNIFLHVPTHLIVLQGAEPLRRRSAPSPARTTARLRQYWKKVTEIMATLLVFTCGHSRQIVVGGGGGGNFLRPLDDSNSVSKTLRF